MTKALLLALLLAASSAAAQTRPTYWGFVALGVGATDTDSTFYAAGVRGFLSVNKLSTFGGLTIMAEVGRLR